MNVDKLHRLAWKVIQQETVEVCLILKVLAILAELDHDKIQWLIHLLHDDPKNLFLINQNQSILNVHCDQLANYRA